MPTPILRDGFDFYNALASPLGNANRWAPVQLSSSPGDASSNVAGRFGGQAMRVAQSAGGVLGKRRFFDGAVAKSEVTAFYAAKPVAAINMGGTFQGELLFNDSTTGTTHILISVGSGGVQVLRNSAGNWGTFTPIGVFNDASIYQLSVWHTIEAQLKIHDTLGMLKVWVNGGDSSGNPQIDLSGIDTRVGASTTCDNIMLLCPSGGGYTSDYDDVVVFDGATGAKVGERRVESLYAVSDGATLTLVPSTGTSHFAVVDESQVSTSDFLSGSNVGDLSLLGLGNLSSTPTTIDEVNVVAYAQKTDASTRAIALGLKSGGATSDGPNFNLAAGFNRYERPVPLNPNGNVAWTAAAIDALELQPKVTV